MQANRITTKADAMAFAIEQAAGDLGKADRIYRMFVDNMELPDMETAVVDIRFKNLTEATEALKRIIEAKLADSTESGQVQTVDEKAPSTLVLPGMPGLEWMTENLSGHGGTEIGGNHDTDHKGSLFIPAAGFRHYSTGALALVGTEGDVWSSSPYSSSSANAGSLAFNSSGVSPQDFNSRAHGFSVRCVRNRQ